MKMLLTSAGITNPSIEKALVEMLGKPIAECDALCIPTALYAHPMAGPRMAYRFFTNTAGNPMLELGWKSVGVLELTALPSMGEDLWLPLLRETDVLLVAGGDTMYLAHWMRESGLAELLPTLDIVWVGLSAGSVVMAPQIGRNFVHWPTRGADDHALGMVDFAIFPHLEYPGMDEHTMSHAERWATMIPTPGYAIDDDTAIAVMNGEIEVISEGTWKLFDR